MPFLPVVEREMRVAARLPRCWWRRVAVAIIGVVILLFVMTVLSANRPPASVGQEMFAGLAGAALIYGLLAGPLTTVDALSREQREGTLGLLYLTNLRSLDVVLGKMASASLDLWLGLTAVLPVAAIPMLLGGVSLAWLAITACAAFNLAFLSLAAGICASSFCQSGRAALGITVAFLGFLTLMVPLVLSEVFNINPSHRLAPFLLMVCPLYTMELTLGGRTALWKFFLNMGAMHALGWFLIAIACVCAARVWRGLPASAPARAWNRAAQWLSSWSFSGRTQRRKNRMLDVNPIYWLESRQVLQGRLLRFLVVITTMYWLFEHFRRPQSWPDNDILILWPMFGHYLFCLWMAIDVPRRVADDKHSGALELLLCTPLTPREIIAGNMRALWRRFGPPFLALVVLYTYGVLWYQARRARAESELNWLAGVGGIVMAVQLYALARVGLYQGLISGNSLRATFRVGWRIGVLPWILFFAGLLCLEWYRRIVRPTRFPDFELILGMWGAVHLVVCFWFVVRSNILLTSKFRLLAGPSWRRPIWQRLFG